MTNRRPPRGAWLAVVTVNAVLAVGLAFVLVPCLIVLADLLGTGPADPTLIDDGLGPWVLAAVGGLALYVVVAVTVNLLVVRRTRLRGQPWLLVAAVVTLVVAGPLAATLTPALW